MVKTLEEVEFDSTAFKANPYPTYAFLRQNAPIYRVTVSSGASFWVVTRYADVQAIFKDERFVKNYRHAASALGTVNLPMEANSREMRIFNQHMLAADGADHTRLRKIVSQAFTPRRMESLRSRIEEIAKELADAMEGQSALDLMTAFAFPLPIQVIAELLGIPELDYANFRSWSNAMMEGTASSKEVAARGMAASVAFLDYMTDFINQRREKLNAGEPESGLIDALIIAEAQGEKLNEEEVLAMIWLLVTAGHDTTVNLIGNGMLALLQRPARMAELKENPELMKAAVEEFLRYDGSVETSTRRFAREDIEFGGELIHKGEWVMVVIAGADRDPGVFTEPDDLDFHRSTNPHMAFGYGIHYCLGAPLARMEGQIAFRTLLERFPNMQLAKPLEELEYRPGILMRGVRSLPVRL